MAPTPYYSYKQYPVLKKEVERWHSIATSSYNYELKKRKKQTTLGGHQPVFDRAAFIDGRLQEKLRASSILKEEAERIVEASFPSDLSPNKKKGLIDDFVEQVINEALDYYKSSGKRRVANGKF